MCLVFVVGVLVGDGDGDGDGGGDRCCSWWWWWYCHVLALALVLLLYKLLMFFAVLFLMRLFFAGYLISFYSICGCCPMILLRP